MDEHVDEHARVHGDDEHADAEHAADHDGDVHAAS